MEIKILPQDVRDFLRSGENISSISQCVMELVLNSLDAKATAVAVRINLLTLRIQIVDNGIGVTKTNMNLIGVRYMTSKCHSLMDLKKTRQFGFRGEALASICQMSRKIDIVSRSEGENNTYGKTHEDDKWSSVEIIKTRPGSGTTITITDFMHNLPVRQKRVRKNLDLEETRRKLEELAIIHCKISFSLRNDATGKIILQSKQIQNVAQALVSFYPHIISNDLVQIKVSKGKISVTGLIYKSPSTNAKLQFIYLNKRPIACTKIQKFLNTLLSKIIPKGEYAVYCLNIRCPYSSVDLTMSPSKTTVEFKNWEIVSKCIEKAVTNVLESEHLVPSVNTKHSIHGEKAASFKSQFGLSQIAGAVKGNRVKRKMKSIARISVDAVPTNLNDKKNNSCLLNQSKNDNELVDVNKKNLSGLDTTKKQDVLHNNTQSLLFSSETKQDRINSLPNLITNRDKGKQLIMDMFLKSTVAYPPEWSQTVTDKVKTVVIEKTAKNKIANTTMTMTIVSKKTIVKNPRVGRNAKSQNMISKCVQTTMVQQHNEMIDYDDDNVGNSTPQTNGTLSKYFGKFRNKEKSEFHCNPKTVAYFGNFGKNFVPNFGRPEYFFRPVPNFSQNADFTVFNVKDSFVGGINRRSVLNFSARYQNPFPLYRPQVFSFSNGNNCVSFAPSTFNFARSQFVNSRLINSNEIYSPYFTNTVATNRGQKRLEISPFFKQPILKRKFCVKDKYNSENFLKPKHQLMQTTNSQISYYLHEHNSRTHNFNNAPIDSFGNNFQIAQTSSNKEPCTNFFMQNQNLFKNNCMPEDILHSASPDLLNGFPSKPSISKKKEHLRKKRNLKHSLGKRETFRKEPTQFKLQTKNKNTDVLKTWMPQKMQPDIQQNSRRSILKNIWANGINLINENTTDLIKNTRYESVFLPAAKKPKLNFFNEPKTSHNFIPHLPQQNYLKDDLALSQSFCAEYHQTNAMNLGNDLTAGNSADKTTVYINNLNSKFLFDANPQSDVQDIKSNTMTNSTPIRFPSSCSKDLEPSFMQLACTPKFLHSYNSTKAHHFKERPRDLFEPKEKLLYLDGRFKQTSENPNLKNGTNARNNKINEETELNCSRFQIPKSTCNKKTLFLPFENDSGKNDEGELNLFKTNCNEESNFNFTTFLMANPVERSNKIQSKTKEDENSATLFRNLAKNQYCSDELIEDKTEQRPAIRKHRSNFMAKSKLSLRKSVSDPVCQPKTFKSVLPFAQSTYSDNLHYDDFKPDLCSTKVDEDLRRIQNSTSSGVVEPTHCNFFLSSFTNPPYLEESVKTNLPEWLQKEDGFGNKFYLNSRTGMTSIIGPKEVNKFSIVKRIDFVPKGLSPIFVEGKKVDVSMSPKSKKELHVALMQSYKNELQTIKWSNFIDTNTDIQDFFQKLYAEKTKHFDNCVPNASVSTLPRCMIKMCNNAGAQSYSRDLLLNLEIIGQWDQKFIVAFSKVKQTLFLFDQHAVSERIRLEKLLKDYKEGDAYNFAKCNMQIANTFSEGDLKILAEFNNHFQSLGFHYTVRGNIVYISCIPSCLHAKNHNDDLEHLQKFIISVICEQLHALKETRGVGLKVPQILLNIVNSEACRGATKFGDNLSFSDCEELIKELHLCQLPFQCAHGRPSFVPIINLERSFLLERCRPNLGKLKN